AESPDAASQGPEEGVDVELVPALEAMALRVPDDVDGDQRGNEQPGQHARRVQAWYRFLRRGAVDDHRDRRRDDDVDRAHGGDEPGGERLRIVRAPHGRPQRLAYGRYGRRPRPA